MWSSVYCNLDSGTLGWWPLGWGRLISHFCMGTYLNKLSYLVPGILSLILWISCKVWSEIHISFTTWFYGWISWCTRCDHLRHMCVDGVVLKLWRCSNSLSPWKLVMVKSLSLYLIFTCLNPDIVLYFPLLLDAWTDLKYIFLDLVSRKDLPLIKQKSTASSTLWCCLAMRGGKNILGMVLWRSGILLVALTCMMVIWGL